MTLGRFLAVGLAAGWIIGKIRRGHGYGLLGNVVIGGIGSVIGWFLIGFLKVEAPNVFAQVAMAVMGAVIFFLLVGNIQWKRKKSSSKEDSE